ncbi:MAG: PA2169 family four-helix-bundle protein [Chloroflexi bacterium]|nr:MAG: PA2169 family four-helix-bundle protein [Chloroflexota bacterium]
MTEQKVLRTLRGLYQIADAGEKGYATAASNMIVPALKILFKFYARQRLDFKNEILTELQRLGDESQPGVSIPGAVHRGRVAIFAGMSDQDGQERVVLREVTRGERAAERAYQKALARDLPEQTREMVERQYREVSQAGAKVRCLRDDVQRRTAVRLAGSEQDTQQAVQTLVSAGIDPDEIETLEINDDVLYEGRGATRAEIILSGIVGGALWGGVMGVLAGFGVVTTTPIGPDQVVLAWLLTALAFTLIGGFISAVLAFFISAGILGRDKYQTETIRENARFLVQARTCSPAE